MLDVATVTADDFDGAAGTVFEVVGPQATPVVLLLRAVAHLRGRPDRRQPFSLEFVGPASPRLDSVIQTLSHKEMGELEIYLEPVAAENDTLIYEAVFN